MSDGTLMESIVLVDSRVLFEHVVRAVRSRGAGLWKRVMARTGGRLVEWDEGLVEVRELDPVGTSFILSRRFAINGRVFNFLFLPPENAHVFGWLGLAQRGEQVEVEGLLCVAQAVSLRDDLGTGDLMVVTEALALPYPALYESRPPKWQKDEFGEEDKRVAECFEAPAGSVDLAAGLADIMRGRGKLTQPEVNWGRTGYAKHPTWNGGMMPWAEEQFDRMREEGIDTLSEMPAGVFDFAGRFPDVPMACFNQIVGAWHDVVRRRADSAEFVLSDVRLLDVYVRSAAALILGFVMQMVEGKPGVTGDPSGQRRQ